jgi:hypothetical protein
VELNFFSDCLRGGQSRIRLGPRGGAWSGFVELGSRIHAVASGPSVGVLTLASACGILTWGCVVAHGFRLALVRPVVGAGFGAWRKSQLLATHTSINYFLKLNLTAFSISLAVGAVVVFV